MDIVTVPGLICYYTFMIMSTCVVLFFCVQDLRLLTQLTTKHGNGDGESLEEKSLTVCSGTDLVNVNYLHLVYPDAETARVCHSL